MAYYRRSNLVKNLTANGDYPTSPVTMPHDCSIAIYGTFDGATLAFVFHTEDESGTLQELPLLTETTFTDAEGPQYYRFPEGMPVKVRITNAGASTDLSVNIHEFKNLD